MAWTINGIRIYVEEHASDVKQQIARLQPIENGTVLHYFGYEEPIIKVTGKVVGKANKDAIESLTMSGSGISFVGDLETITVGVNSVNCTRIHTIAQTIDSTQDCSAPVYTVALELYKEI